MPEQKEMRYSKIQRICIINLIEIIVFSERTELLLQGIYRIPLGKLPINWTNPEEIPFNVIFVLYA